MYLRGTPACRLGLQFPHNLFYLIQVVIKVLMDEIRVACRSSKAEPTMSSELQQCFKLLTLVVSHGSHGIRATCFQTHFTGNLVLNLDDLVTLFLSTAKETSMCFVRLPLFRALQMLFQRCESHSVALRPSLWDGSCVSRNVNSLFQS